MIRRAFALPLIAALAFAGEVNAQSPRLTPADPAKQARAEQDYLAKVGSKLSDYKFNADVQPTNNVIEVQFAVARDGRLLDAKIVRSSGTPALDKGALDALRKSSPYARLPPEIPGMNATFKLSINVRSE